MEIAEALFELAGAEGIADCRRPIEQIVSDAGSGLIDELPDECGPQRVDKFVIGGVG